MEFAILGPLKVVEGERDLTPRRAKQRALLAMLLLHPNEVVGNDQLVDALWGEAPPASAPNAMHGHVSALRKLLGAERIETHASGYLLRLSPAELDSTRFQALVTDARRLGRPEARSTRLREALALWRGAPLADLGYESFAQPEIARLAELRLAALEDRIDADLARARHHDLVGDLERAVAEHPFRERLRGHLMLALYRCGRQADALHAFQDGRRLLVEELGIDPGAALQQLHEQILKQDPSLDLQRTNDARPRDEPGLRAVSWGAVRYAHNGSVSIAYRVGGQGPVDVLFIGGFVSHLDIAAEPPLAHRFWERLASFARVVTFDKRGMGLSDRDAGAYTLENIVDDALAVLDAVGLERVVVFGVSEGGAAATVLAATHPDRISAMVQYGTYARMSQAAEYPQGVPLEVLRRGTTRMIERWGDPGTIDRWAPSVAADPEVRAWWARLVRSGGSPGSMRAIGLMYEELDVRSLLSAVTVPTLVLYRAGDRVVAPALSRTVARGIPGAHEVELAGADHLFLAGDQQAMLDAVEEFVTGRPPAAAHDRILATVLFTDIVGSTERAAELGDRSWRELLAQHERLVEREVARYRGWLVKSTGDGVLATFDGPARAVRSALAIRERVRAIGLELRAGVHTGECEVMASDVAGIAVNLTARVQAAARPGEVLTSSTVKDIVVGSGLVFEDRGLHVLKGVPGEWPLYAVTGDAEQARAPVAAPAGGRDH